MFEKIKPIIKTETKETKSFNFSKEINKDSGVNLSFSLRIDIKQELFAFLELLQEAEKNIKEEIKNRFE